jgi:hypothetical protein
MNPFRFPAPSCARRFLLVAAVPLMALQGGGCVAALGAGTVAATDKTPIDHVYSLVSGKDCSFVRKHRGLTYCAEDEIILETALHCYPTLGEITCYRTADPYPGGQGEVGAAARPDSGGAGGQIARTPSKTN